LGKENAVSFQQRSFASLIRITLLGPHETVFGMLTIHPDKTMMAIAAKPFYFVYKREGIKVTFLNVKQNY
jgi:hypothetical protein